MHPAWIEIDSSELLDHMIMLSDDTINHRESSDSHLQALGG
jgi:hypothetical protein